MTAEEYFQTRNGGKPSDSGETITETYAILLMEEYAKQEMILFGKWLCGFKMFV